MFYAVTKSVALLFMIAFGIIGLITSAAITALIIGIADITQVVTSLQYLLDNSEWAGSILAGATTGTAVRTGTPYVIGSVRGWFADFIRQQIEQQLK